MAGMTASHAYENKRDQYFANAREDYVARLHANSDARILELGCGNGATGRRALQTGKCGFYAGLELAPGPAHEARQVLSQVVEGNVEDILLPWPKASFDALIASEVLEHLHDPQAALLKLAGILKPGALVLASSPNIASFKIVRALACGRFDYADEGAMDRTHLRWFTPATFSEMFENAGIEVLELGPVGHIGWKRRVFDILSIGRFHHMLYEQINLFGRVRGGVAG